MEPIFEICGEVISVREADFKGDLVDGLIGGTHRYRFEQAEILNNEVLPQAAPY